jgi:hypothetical protein
VIASEKFDAVMPELTDTSFECRRGIESAAFQGALSSTDDGVLTAQAESAAGAAAANVGHAHALATAAASSVLEFICDISLRLIGWPVRARAEVRKSHAGTE